MVPDSRSREITGTAGTYQPGGRSAWRAFSTSFYLLNRGVLALPLLIYFALKLAIVFLYLAKAGEPWSSFWAFFLPGVGAEATSHYPSHLILMPAVLRRLDIPLDVLVHIVFQGATVLLVSAAYSRKNLSLGGSFGGALGNYTRLVGVTLLASVVILLITSIPTGFFGLASEAPPGRAATALSMLLGLTAQAFFLYSMPFVLLGGRSVPDAVRRSFAMAGRHFIHTFILAAVPFALTVPTLLLGFKAVAISFRLSPEFLVHVQIAGEVMQLVATYILTASLTVAFIWKRQPAAHEGGTDAT